MEEKKGLRSTIISLNERLKELIEVKGTDSVLVDLPENIQNETSEKTFAQAVRRITAERKDGFYSNCSPYVNASVYTLHYVLKSLGTNEDEFFDGLESGKDLDKDKFLRRLDSKFETRFNSTENKLNKILEKLEPDHRTNLIQINQKMRILFDINKKIAESIKNKNLDTATLVGYCAFSMQILKNNYDINQMVIQAVSVCENGSVFHNLILLLSAVFLCTKILESYFKSLIRKDADKDKNNNKNSLINDETNSFTMQIFNPLLIRLKAILKIFPSDYQKDCVNNDFKFNKYSDIFSNFFTMVATVIPEKIEFDGTNLKEVMRYKDHTELLLLKTQIKPDFMNVLKQFPAELENLEFELFPSEA